MVKRIEIKAFGGPETMTLTEAPDPTPGPGEVLVEHTAIGVNFVDIYHRSGLYSMTLPSGLGMEAAGVIAATGESVEGLSIGDRVAYCAGPVGAYAERHIVKTDRLVRLPDSIPDEVAAASLLKGLTTQYLIRQTYPVSAGETVLFHAAAGGVGRLACQWLKHLGVTVIGVVGTEAKIDIARSAGCDHVILQGKENIADRVIEITDEAKVPVVYDSVGAATWEASLDSLRSRGLLVSFGNASGQVKDVNLGVLAAKGSLFVTRPTLYDYIPTKEALDAAAAELFDVLDNVVKVEITGEYPLVDAAQAHVDLESRKTSGSIILRP